MPLLNYTTTIAVDKTVGEIQKILAAAGAKAIQIDYASGFPAAVAFFIDTPFESQSVHTASSGR